MVGDSGYLAKAHRSTAFRMKMKSVAFCLSHNEAIILTGESAPYRSWRTLRLDENLELVGSAIRRENA